MQSEIIFIRHGDANINENKINDTYSGLTEKGNDQINKIAQKIKDNLNINRDLTIFSSPALRSIQTAQIIAERLGESEIKKREWILNGDIESLIDEIKNAGDEFCIIIIGHEPYLNYWSRRMSGYSLPYDKGTVVCFEIISNEPMKAVPVWFAQSEDMDFRHRDMDVYTPVIKEFQKIISYQLQDILNKQMQFWKFPDSADTAYSILKKMQAFRCMLIFFKSMMNELEFENIQTEFDLLIDNFAALHEIDLLINEWKHLATVHPELTGILSAFISSLNNKRNEEKDAIYKKVFENMTGLLFKLLMWVKAEDVQEKDLHNMTIFKELRWSMLS